MTTRYTANLGAISFDSSRSGRMVQAVAGITLSLATSMCGVSVVHADPSVAPKPSAASATDLVADPAASPVDTSPLPTDADGLLDRLNEASRQAEATSDHVVRNLAELKAAGELLDRSNVAVVRYSEESTNALIRAEEARGPVTELSLAMYRGATIDPVTAMVGATSPQEAIDRRAYGSALNASRTAMVEELQDSLTKAASAHSLAQRMKATADYRLSEYGHRQRDLDARAAVLEQLKTQISTAVDAMPLDQRQRWIERNGPIDVDVEEFLSGVTAAARGVVGAALSKLGAPYSWGAAGPDAFDCSGLMYWAYQQMGKTIPRTSGAQIAGGTPVSRDQLQPGDIVGYYSGVSHVGMYIGDGKIVHASDYGIPVQVVSVDSMPFAGASRY